MARGRFQKKRSPLGPILIILVLAAIAAAVLYFTGVLGHRHHCSAPADCTVARYCDECGKLMEAAHQDHTAGPAATCETPQTCTVCGKHLNEAIPAEGHEWGKWVTLRAATEDRPGEQERTCQVCGAKQTREVDYQGDMPKTGVFTVPTAWLVAALALSLTGYIALKRKSERG